MRLFIAIDFDSPDFFSNLQLKLDRNSAKITLAKSFHLTLKFLGEVNEGKVGWIISKLNSIKLTPFSIVTVSMGVFPNLNNARVIWVGFENDSKILELQKLIDEMLADLFPKDIDFRAHITLARIKEVFSKEGLKRNLEGIKVERKEFLVKEFKLIKSTLLPSGSVYDDLNSFK